MNKQTRAKISSTMRRKRALIYKQRREVLENCPTKLVNIDGIEVEVKMCPPDDGTLFRFIDKGWFGTTCE